MRQFISIFILITIQAFINSDLCSQGFLRTEGKEIVNEHGEPYILKGMGLGGWMLQEGYMLQTAGFANSQHKIREKIEGLIGESATKDFYEAWLTNHMRKVDVDSLASWGFNSVRLPMHYNLYTLPIEEEPVRNQNTWLDKGFLMTDSLISWCAQNEMYVVLDLHAAPGGQGYDEGISDYDPDKPSLWESKENRDKTVALWKRLAERYVDEPWVAGYDLINEPNWNISGNILLKNLYLEITDSIRTVDTNHIIFIEGNWFANDFTNLTPPWDNNMVYSPHKYWSINDKPSIQWVLDIREQYNVPIYFGESGENSNTWFTDAIELFAENNLGWAWWPLKKVESVAGPLSITKSPGYESLLDYWNNGGIRPSAATAEVVLMQLTEDLKIENCKYQKDVIDAMFRQVTSNETVPYNTQDIPGIVYATDFDLGVVGEAYFDNDIANYQVSSGNFTAWNQGWSYRNDGIDIESSMDNINTNGFNVGWCTENEWMQYDINVAESGTYEAKIRIASLGGSGQFHFSTGGGDITEIMNVPNTGDWQTWQELVVPNIVLDKSDKKLRFNVDRATFNVSSFEFIRKGDASLTPLEYISSVTKDNNTIQANVNRQIKEPLPSSPAGFRILVNASEIPITKIELAGSNSRIVNITVDHNFRSTDNIRISYNGDGIVTSEGSRLTSFSNRIVKNTIDFVYNIPGKIEAEGYFFQEGIQLEATSDIGGGQNIGYLDIGDYLDYNIDVTTAGTYQVNYRTAALSEMGQIELYLTEGEIHTLLHTVTFPSTGGWQTWSTTSAEAELKEGRHQLRVVITQPLFNINWFEFSFLTSIYESPQILEAKLFPNPGDGLYVFQAKLTGVKDVLLQIYNSQGQPIRIKELKGTGVIEENFNLEGMPEGQYYITIISNEGVIYSQPFSKLSRN